MYIALMQLAMASCPRAFDVAEAFGHRTEK